MEAISLADVLEGLEDKIAQLVGRLESLFVFWGGKENFDKSLFGCVRPSNKVIALE